MGNRGLFGLAAVGGLAAALLLLALFKGWFSFSAGEGFFVCSHDGEIEAARLSRIDETALVFVRKVLAQDASAYAMMTQEAQATSTADRFLAIFKPNIALEHGAFTNAHVEHTWVVRVAGTAIGEDVAMHATCDGGVIVAARPNHIEAHVVVSLRSGDDLWAFVLMLEPDGDDWKVLNAFLVPAGKAGLPAETLLAMATRERDAGHRLNAALLYQALFSTIDRGPTLRLAIEEQVQDAVKSFSFPPELTGKPPVTWTLQGKPFVIAQVGTLSVKGRLGLVFVLPHPTWPGDKGADAANRAFLDAFRATHPDYARVYGFLVARAMKPDNSGGFGTVYENGKGYTG